MKKILLAVSALALSAGAVSAQNVSAGNAEFRLGGYARFGLGYVENRADEWQTASRLRLQFEMTTTTDGGLTIGARQRFQTEENAANSGGNAAYFYVAYEGLRVGMGNIIGVVEGSPLLYMNSRSAGIGLEGLECGDHVAQHGRVQRVERLRAVERDQPDLAAGFDEDRLIGHDASPCWWWRRLRAGNSRSGIAQAWQAGQ